VNKLGAELMFKGGDVFADGRLTHSTLPRGSGEALFFDHSDEYLHRIEPVHTAFLFLYGMIAFAQSA
jgi:hypothetical protein